MAKNFSTTAAKTTTTAAAPKRTRAKKSVEQMHSLESVEIVSDTPVVADDDLTALLAELGAADDEVVVVSEPVTDAEPVTVATATDELEEALLEAAVGSAEASEAAAAAADDGSGDDPAAAPSAPAAEGKVKKAAVRKHYSDKVERLVDRVGDKLAEFTVLTINDAPIDDEAMKATMDATLAIIRGMNSKEKNRAGNFIEFLSGKRAKLNNVLERVLKVLERDGCLTTGNEGNVFKDLIARPYSPASARAMGGNTVGMFADLKVILPEGKGKFVANPDSLLLMKAQSLLEAGATAPAAEAAAHESDDEVAAEVEAAEVTTEVATTEVEEALF